MANDLDLEELAAELEDFAPPENEGGRSPREERIIAGFEDVQRFYEEHGRAPRHGEDRDIFERLYAVRLDRLRALAECRAILTPLDRHGLLAEAEGDKASSVDTLDDDELLAELEDSTSGPDITDLRHVRTSAEKRAAEEIANRSPCPDFAAFKPLFEQVKADIESGARETRPFELKSEIEPGRYFVVGGQLAYVADKGEVFTNDQGRRDARLRVIFDNGTQSNMLMRSLQRSLHKDDAGRRITEPAAGPLFGSDVEEADVESGTIYVLRSKSNHPTIAANRQVIHKIGVTGGEVKDRIAAAAVDPTYLLASVELVATYNLANINRVKLEQLLHRFFAPAQIDLEIVDRFGKPVKPREWFLVPRDAIDEAVKRIVDGSIEQYAYDPASAKLVKRQFMS